MMVCGNTSDYPFAQSPGRTQHGGSFSSVHGYLPNGSHSWRLIPSPEAGARFLPARRFPHPLQIRSPSWIQVTWQRMHGPRRTCAWLPAEHPRPLSPSSHPRRHFHCTSFQQTARRPATTSGKAEYRLPECKSAIALSAFRSAVSLLRPRQARHDILVYCPKER